MKKNISENEESKNSRGFVIFAIFSISVFLYGVISTIAYALALGWIS